MFLTTKPFFILQSYPETFERGKEWTTSQQGITVIARLDRSSYIMNTDKRIGIKLVTTTTPTNI